MNRIVTRDVLYTPVPVKLYVHATGLDLFGTKKREEHAKVYARTCVEHLCLDQQFTKNAYGVGIVWGDTATSQHVLDLVVYTCVNRRGDEWRKENPSSSNYVVRNRIATLSRELSCEDGMILFGKEAELRRTTFCIETYLADVPHDLGKITRLDKLPK